MGASTIKYTEKLLWYILKLVDRVPLYLDAIYQAIKLKHVA